MYWGIYRLFVLDNKLCHKCHVSIFNFIRGALCKLGYIYRLLTLDFFFDKYIRKSIFT
jgi:hypothetical protein